MIISDLLKLNWKKDFRAQGFYKGLAVKILMGFIGLYFATIFLFLGFFLGDILDEVSPTLKPLEIFNGITLYLILGSLLLRFFMMQLNTINLQSYQSLPIKRHTLVNFILLRPVFSWINYFILLAIIPFAIKSVSAYYSVFVAFRFVLNFILIIWFDILIASFLKRKFGSSLSALVIFLVVAAGLVALEYLENIFIVWFFNADV
ncbi:MAG: DUF5687 family protein [Paludibacteraceae bacterium]